MDYPVAAALASEVISVPAFASMKESDYERAFVCAKSCERVICCVEAFGEENVLNKKLRDAFLFHSQN